MSKANVVKHGVLCWEHRGEQKRRAFVYICMI